MVASTGLIAGRSSIWIPGSIVENQTLTWMINLLDLDGVSIVALLWLWMGQWIICSFGSRDGYHTGIWKMEELCAILAELRWRQYHQWDAESWLRKMHGVGLGLENGNSIVNGDLNGRRMVAWINLMNRKHIISLSPYLPELPKSSQSLLVMLSRVYFDKEVSRDCPNCQLILCKQPNYSALRTQANKQKLWTSNSDFTYCNNPTTCT